MAMIEAGIVKRIHVNQRLIRARAEKPICVYARGHVTHASEVEIFGDSKLVYRPERPISSGARLWIETHAAVVLR